MSPKETPNRSRALEGVHGVHVAPHSPFSLRKTNQSGEFHPTTCGTSTAVENQLLSMPGVWQQIPACLRPIHCSTSCHGDMHLAETVANVLTSIPFIALGMHAPRKNLNSKLYANSLIGVGVASSVYHSSRGKLRKYLRWIDYTMIATATVCLSRALRNENPKILMAATAAFLPVQPLMVSLIHTGMMEVAFAKRALKDPDLRMAHTVHKMSSEPELFRTYGTWFSNTSHGYGVTNNSSHYLHYAPTTHPLSPLCILQLIHNHFVIFNFIQFAYLYYK